MDLTKLNIQELMDFRYFGPSAPQGEAVEVDLDSYIDENLSRIELVKILKANMKKYYKNLEALYENDEPVAAPRMEVFSIFWSACGKIVLKITKHRHKRN